MNDKFYEMGLMDKESIYQIKNIPNTLWNMKGKSYSFKGEYDINNKEFTIKEDGKCDLFLDLETSWHFQVKVQNYLLEDIVWCD